MKNYLKYGLLGLSFAFLLSSCEKDEPFFYDANQNGVYFDYDNAEQFKQNINFAQHMLGNPTELPVTVNLKIIGYHSDVARKAVMKFKEVEGFPLANVTVPEIIFEAGEVEKEVEVMIARPAEMDKEYAACFYLDSEDPESQLGSAVLGKEEFTVYVKEAYKKPNAWDAMGPMYLGEWNIEKHIFFINLTKDNEYDADSKLYDYQRVVTYNKMAVDSLRAQAQAHPGEPITIAIPFVSDNQYDKPSYWGEYHDKYLGEYNGGLFATLCSATGANTSNENELLAGDENVVKELNKKAVLGMMANYDMYFSQWGMPGISFRDMSWIPMFTNIDYDVTEPACWKPGMMGDESLLLAYYGEYSDEKYKFMIKTWLEEKGTQEFCLVQMFPLVWDWGTMNGVWDESMGGEAAIKECYKVFKAAYDKNPSDSFTFPVLTIE